MATSLKSSFLTNIVGEAIKKDASDILLSFDCSPILKVEGRLVQLKDLGILTDADLAHLIEQIVPRSKLPILEEERQVDTAYSHGDTRFRVNVFYQRGHISVAMRYVKGEIPELKTLGLPEITKDLLNTDSGLILLVGPTGAGKSTSMASMVEYINQNSDRHIITIEDPIEYVYQNKKSIIEQREVGIDAPSFASALRATLREAPDIILLGEMRDLESISTAVTVAETGHLVLSTVHANSAAGSIDRIIDIFPEGTKDQIRIQLADILIAVFNQRLVPSSDGNGNTLMVEVMMGTSAVRNAIRTANSAELPSIIQTSAAEGMYLLDDLLVKAVKRGEITKESALANASDRNLVKKQLN